MKNNIIKLFLLWVVALMALPASAQQRRISGTVSDDIDVIIGANVKEIDKNNRIVSQAVTDMNGNFTMNIKDPNNTLEITYIGYKKFSQKIGSGKSVFRVTLQDNTKTIKEVTVTGKKMSPTTGLEIPAREYAGAVSKFDMNDVEGLAFESVDQALQGQIPGLDIVPNSGNLGSGTTMRLRGTSTINGNQTPLIVLNDHIFQIPEDERDKYDWGSMDNEEQFSTLLQVNPEDIESITVLKDAASTAKWGADGANGVIEIKTRRGHRGKTRVNFSYKFKGTWQPEGYEMLNGDGYTMMLKEAYYNPNHKDTKILELDYNNRLPYIYPHFNKNTDWVKEVTQFGQEHKFSINLSGGGEKAQFRISANYDKSTGTIIGQTLNRFTSNTALDYWVSDRIKFSSNISLAFTTNNKNDERGGKPSILSRAYDAMPNMSVYEYDANWNPTGNYFFMHPLAATLTTGGTERKENDERMTSYELRDMFVNGNPVARAKLAWWKMKQYNLTPQFNVEYKLLGKTDDEHRLNYVGDVQLNIYNTSHEEYTPSELRPMAWVWGGDNSAALTANERNYVGNEESKSLEFTTRHDLRYYSAFKNRDHSVAALVRFEMAVGNSSYQDLSLWNVPNGITDPTVVALLRDASSGNNEWRRHSFYGQVHYSYKSKYSIDGSVRWDGRPGFGRGHKYPFFPAVGARWNVIDEGWMKWSKNWLSMLGLRASWGITGGNSDAGSSQYNKYRTSGYYNGHQVIIPENLSLSDLRCEKTKKINFGLNIGFFKDLITFEGEIYNHKTTDMIMYNLRIPSANGFNNLGSVNAGVLRNKGWELNFYTSRICKVGKFSMKLRGNISQNFNQLEEMNPLLLEAVNGAENYKPTNESYTKLVQTGNALGSLYGLHYLGVYKYDYDHSGETTSSWHSYGYAESVPDGNGGYRNSQSLEEAKQYGDGWHYSKNATTGEWYRDYEINTAAAAERRGDISTCPIARDAGGKMLTDAKGNPLPMYYCYNEGENYRTKFQGGDAIYEDINHDGQIDRYDIVYLGNSNPKCNGGFGIQLFFGRFSINAGFNFRIGNQILNLARMRLESMLDNKNQSFATTWRWRKNGDETVIPRALNNSNTGYTSYNSLTSDRYIEKGDYLRLQYIQFSYDFDAKKLKKYGINQLKLFASMDNLWCWTKYTGIDPDVAQDRWGQSVDNNKTPRPKSFTCSINLGF